LGKEGEEGYVDVYHAWLVEDLEGGRVRILTQESQIGEPAREFGLSIPNKVCASLNGKVNLDGWFGHSVSDGRRSTLP
jgi:hypothetical protein